jgi:hypothetical protein
MQKNEILNALKEKLNPTEFETLGITSRTDKATLQGYFDQLVNVEKNPELTYLPGEESKPETEVPEGEEESKTEVTEGESLPGSDDFDVLLGKISSAEGQPKAEKKETPLITKEKRKRKKNESSAESFHVEGYILLLAVDTLFPTILAVVNNMVDKKHKKLIASDLALAQKDFDKLEPLADQAADYMTVHLNPIAGFFLIASFMYANNMIVAKMV